MNSRSLWAALIVLSAASAYAQDSSNNTVPKPPPPAPAPIAQTPPTAPPPASRRPAPSKPGRGLKSPLPTRRPPAPNPMHLTPLQTSELNKELDLLDREIDGLTAGKAEKDRFHAQAAAIRASVRADRLPYPALQKQYLELKAKVDASGNKRPRPPHR